MTRPRRHVRLLAWWGLILAVGAVAFASREEAGGPGKNYFYRWDNAIGGAVQYLVLLGLTLLIATGLQKRAVFALRRPSSWRKAALIAVVLLIAVYVVGAVIAGVFGDPGKEQGLTPSYWDGHRAAPFFANLAVVAIAAPIVEELLFRGLGFTLLQRFGRWPAIVLVGLAFGAWHGLVLALPILALFGAGLAYMRARTGSVYPGMALHAVFNAVAVIASVAS